MTWKVKFSKDAEKQFFKLSKNIRSRIISKLEDVQESPFTYIQRMVGSKNYRLRVGDYRLIFEVINDKLLLHIIRVDKRSRMYQ